jgi:putative FmdB family regulatory protein
MPLRDFKCLKCNHIQEYLIYDEKTDHPKKCEKCGSKKIKVDPSTYNFQSEGIDIIGGYEMTYGKKAWKKRLSVSQQADVLLGKRNPW